MRVKFKQAVSLDGKDYPRGVHDVPEKAVKHPTFHKLILAGYVDDAEAGPAPLSAKAAQDAFAERIFASRAKSGQAASAVPQSPADPVPSMGPPADDVADAPAPSSASEDPVALEEGVDEDDGMSDNEDAGAAGASEEGASAKQKKKKKR